MASAMRWAPVPRPGKFLGQAVIIFQRRIPLERAGAVMAVAATVVAAAPATAAFKNDRRGNRVRFIGYGFLLVFSGFFGSLGGQAP